MDKIFPISFSILLNSLSILLLIPVEGKKEQIEKLATYNSIAQILLKVTRPYKHAVL